jgi:hypothetical protein
VESWRQEHDVRVLALEREAAMKAVRTVLVGCAVGLVTSAVMAACRLPSGKECYQLSGTASVVNSSGGVEDQLARVISVTKDGKPATEKDRKAMAELQAYVKANPNSSIKVDQLPDANSSSATRVPNRVVAAAQSNLTLAKAAQVRRSKTITGNSVTPVK